MFSHNEIRVPDRGRGGGGGALDPPPTPHPHGKHSVLKQSSGEGTPPLPAGFGALGTPTQQGGPRWGRGTTTLVTSPWALPTHLVHLKCHGTCSLREGVPLMVLVCSPQCRARAPRSPHVGITAPPLPPPLPLRKYRSVCTTPAPPPPFCPRAMPPPPPPPFSAAMQMQTTEVKPRPQSEC